MVMAARSASVPPTPRNRRPAVVEAAGNWTVHVFRPAAWFHTATLIILVPAPKVTVPAALLLLEAVLRLFVPAVMLLLLDARFMFAALRFPVDNVIVPLLAL